MRKTQAAAMVITMFGAAALMAGTAVSKTESQAALKKEAKVTQEAASKTALERAPGQIESSELEREHGHLIWSFDIRNAKGTIDEVAVDAVDGKIVTVEHENKQQEEAEKKQEAKEKAATKKH